MKYLIHTTNDAGQRVGTVLNWPSGLTGDQYGEVQTEYAKRHGKTNPKSAYDTFAHIARLDEHDRTDSGIYYVYDLCYDGAMFTLFKFPSDSNADVRNAREQLEREQDVVSMQVFKIVEEPYFAFATIDGCLHIDPTNYTPTAYAKE